MNDHSPHPPLFLPTAKKHSPIDWNYNDSGNFEIYETGSGPSPGAAICNRQEAQGQISPSFYLKQSFSPDIPQGKIVNWAYIQGSWEVPMRFLFRVQALPTNWQPANCYQCRIGYTDWYIYKHVAGEETQLFTKSLETNISIGTWIRFRLSFWEYLTEFLVPMLRCHLEQYVAGEWTEEGIYDIVDPLWTASGQNRSGLMMSPEYPGASIWFDDTEIWEAA